MASILSPSITSINGPKFVTRSSPPPPPSCVRFRQSHIISSVSSTTAVRNCSHFNAPSASLYEVLGIQMGATCHEIKTAYRKLARKLHPDVVSCNGRKYESSGEDFKRIHAAYSTLSDAQKRADYDRKMSRTSFKYTGSAGSRVSGSMRRRWETDQCW